eukprot:783164-Rhodomonas_salina.1
MNINSTILLPLTQAATYAVLTAGGGTVTRTVLSDDPILVGIPTKFSSRVSLQSTAVPVPLAVARVPGPGTPATTNDHTLRLENCLAESQ